MAMPEKVKKRDGRIVKFDQSKITEAIYKAAESVDGSDRELAEALAGKVTEVLEKLFNETVPTIEDVQDTVEKVLINSGHSRTAKSFILYRKKRDEIRAKTKVRKVVKKKASTTDKHLLVDSDASMEYQEWNKARIADSLVNEKGIQPDEAAKIASIVEKRVIQSGVSRISLALIRELVNNELFERGYTELLERQTLIGMTVSEMDDLIHSKSKENANITANNPEAINLAMSEFMQKQYALVKVFSPDVAEFHRDGRVHLHDLGMPVRVYSYHQDETMVVKHHDRLYNISFKRLWELSDAAVVYTGDMEIKMLTNTFVTDSGGVWTRVKQIMRHKNTKKMLSVENDAGKSVIVTEDHPFIVNKELARYHECPVCGEKTSRTNGSTKPGSKTYMCKCGKQFMKRDIPYDVKSTVGIPTNEVCADHMSIVDLSFPKNDFNSSEIIPINEDLAYIIGLFVSEGSTEEQSVYISGKNHKEVVIDFCSRNSLSFGDKGDGVSIYSKAFKNTLDMWGVTGYSHEKALPDFYLSLPHDTLWKMLIGVIDGDGTSRDCEISVRITSRCLVSQLMQLCRRLGVRSRISAIEHYESETSFKGTKQMYSLAIYPSESDLVKLAASRRERFQIIPSSKKTMRNKSDRDIFCSRIKNVREVDYHSEYVYDITTESSTFLCNELLVHNCSGHSLEYIKMYGLDLWTMDTKSAPAKHANTLTGHLNTFLSNMQAYYAGALGLGAVNVFYAPYLEDSTDNEILQVAQYMIFSGAQNCFSRGGQSLHPEELIWVKEVGKYRSVRIGQYVDDIIRESNAVEASFDYEVVRTEDYGIQTISFDKDGKVSDKMVKYVARIPHTGKMYRLFTERGIVNITGDHSVFTYTGKGQIVPTKASELKVSDYVVTPHRINIPNVMETVDMTEYIEHDQISIKGAEKIREKAKEKYGKNYTKPLMRDFGVNGGYLKDGLESDKIRFDIAKHFVNYKEEKILLKGDSQECISPILPLTHELGYLAGMFCSEGHVSKKTVVISNRNIGFLDRISNYLDSIGYNGHHRGELDIYKNKKGEIRNCAHEAITGVFGMFIAKSCSENKEKKIPDWVLTGNQDCVDGFLAGFLDGDGLLTRATWAASNTSPIVISGLSFLLLRSERESNVFETKKGEENKNWKTLYEIRESIKRTVNPFNDKRTTESFAKYYKNSNKTVRDAVEWLIASDLSLARIRAIESYTYTGYVYDISVPETEAFLGGLGNIFFKNTLFLDFNINAGVPSYLKDVPAVGAGGKYTGRTYGSYEKTAQRMAKAMLRVWHDGDSNGHILQFPKPNFHINEETFSDPGQREVFDYACQVSAHNGTPYFAFDRDSASQSACCRLRFTIEDEELLKHPERQRFCGFQNVTVNLPQCAYRAGKGKIRKLYAEIDKAMDICLKAHLQKKAYIAGLMAAPNLPLWQLGKIVSDGKPYVELDKCTYIIGMIGLNECVQYLLGKELHEDDETLKAGLRIISHMFYTVKEFGEKYGLKFTLEESPAESASRRFARIDLKKFPESAEVVKGDIEKDEVFYTNSIHLNASCNVDLVQRIIKQAKFHNLIESGAIIHAFVGENRPSAKSIAKLVEMTYRKTNAAQITISPEFTICNRCKKMIPGMSVRCQSCGAENITEAKRKAASPDGTWTKENIEKFKKGKE